MIVDLWACEIGASAVEKAPNPFAIACCREGEVHAGHVEDSRTNMWPECDRRCI